MWVPIWRCRYHELPMLRGGLLWYPLVLCQMSNHPHLMLGVLNQTQHRHCGDSVGCPTRVSTFHGVTHKQGLRRRVMPSEQGHPSMDSIKEPSFCNHAFATNSRGGLTNHRKEHDDDRSDLDHQAAAYARDLHRTPVAQRMLQMSCCGSTCDNDVCPLYQVARSIRETDIPHLKDPF